MKSQAAEIQKYILEQLPNHAMDIVEVTSKYFSVTRTTVHRHLNKLLKDNLILKSGTTSSTVYCSRDALTRQMQYELTDLLNENDIFQKDFEDIFKHFPENIYDICHYGFTEILNNAIDHAQASKVKISTAYEQESLSIKISDNGIGLFRKIKDYFKLEDLRESILQINKGKMTTDPTNHTGEGIFFTSKAFEIFEVIANGFLFMKDNLLNDWGLREVKTKQAGSTITMTINKYSKNNLIELFKTYQDPDSLAFDRTKILVELSKLGDEKLISRSQAKRIILGLEKFQRVTLDFKGIKLVGQGFVDEIFRVYVNSHPDIAIDYVNANEDVTFMIRRGLMSK